MGHPVQEGKQKLDGVLECVRKTIPVADFIEINESCPNVKHGGDSAGLAARLAAVTTVRDEMTVSTGRRVPIFVKLGDVGEPEATVQLLAKHGVDGIVALNTQRDYSSFDLPALDKSLLEHYTSIYGGGLSGPPIKERSMKQAASVVAAVREQGLQNSFVVVHVGGLSGARDVQSSRKTGAELRQWYTGMVNALAEGHCNPMQLYPSVTASA
jgi:dihydroorotate dehydrogenase